MNIKFINLPDEVKTGAQRITKFLGFNISDDGIVVNVSKGEKLVVKTSDDGIILTYKEKIQFFRALGHLNENLKKGGDFCIEEYARFNSTGVMPDLSTDNSVTVKSLQTFMDYLAVMGINFMLLYMEDMYELPSRKFFGYMRGRYSPEELRAIDDYAFEYGIEVIACMQTLGHMQRYFKWGESADVREFSLLGPAREFNVDTEKTYELIEEMIVESSKHLRSKRIHIGMDEAWGMGRGDESFKKYGLRDQKEIFVNHLNRVYEIVKKHGLTPIIWNDFIFCLYSETGIDKYEIETEVPQEMMDRFPEDVKLVYWHYGEEKNDCDDYMLKKYLKFNNEIYFAGGLLMWMTTLPDNQLSLVATEEAMKACKDNNIKEVFTTLWGGMNIGLDFNTALLHLQQYAEHTYNDRVPFDKLKERFEACTGAKYDAFVNMSQFGNTVDDMECKYHSSRYMSQSFMWDDPLMGISDSELYKKSMWGHFAKWAKYYGELCNPEDKWFDLYDRCRLVFEYLAIKCYIAEFIKPKYMEGDKEFLVRCEKELYPELLKKTKDLHEKYRSFAKKTVKSFSWKILDEKFAVVEARTITAIDRLSDYNNGRISFIEELDEARL